MTCNFFFSCDTASITITAETEEQAWRILEEEVKRPGKYILESKEKADE